MTKLVAAISTYNDSKIILDTLESLRRIKDLDAVDVLDGAWFHGGDTLNSSDGTLQVVDDFRLSKRSNFEVFHTYRAMAQLYKSESEKRNWHLEDIWHRFGEDSWIFVIDADEELEMLEPEIEIKPLLQGNKCGIIDAHSISTPTMLPSLRLFPPLPNLHYHTNKAMCVHDENCNVIMDYELQVISQPEKVYKINEFKLLNKGTQRSPERLKAKTEYFAWRMRNEGGKCRYWR